MKVKGLLASIALIVLVQCCKNEEQKLGTTYLELPANPDRYGTSENDFIPTLGRVLFYDNQLSVNNSVSCASCHKQVFAFADNTALSKGFENRHTTRNALPIQNLLNRFETFRQVGNDSSNVINDFVSSSSPVLFWDGRENNIQTMVLRPIANHVEMGIADMGVLTKKLSSIPYYNSLFTNAYGKPEITPDNISKALASFISSINARNTKFDKANLGALKLSALELKGKELFVTTYNCNSCHQVGDPHGYIAAGTFSNIGLDPIYTDNGLGNVTLQVEDQGKFKIPSLRNVALTAPYMHDGRFGTLEEVIDHYSGGIEDHPNLDERLRGSKGEPIQMSIPTTDKKAIITFLNTLTDYEMIADSKLSSPFKIK